MKYSKTTKLSIFLISVGIILSVTVASLTLFKTQMSKLLRQYSITNIMETQSLYTDSLKQQFDYLFNMLESQARYFEKMDLNDDSQLKSAITKTKGLNDFKKIAISNIKGVTTNYTGQGLANLRNKPFFIDCLVSGQNSISNRIEFDENLEPILSLAFPIKEGEVVKAVLSGTISYNMLKDIFKTQLFNGQCYTYIIANDGNIVFCNKDKKKLLYNVNFYDYLLNNSIDSKEDTDSMKIAVINHKTGSMELECKDAQKIFTYAPLNINDWYIISVLPVNYIKHQQSSITRLVVALLIVLIFSLLIFLFLTFMLYLRSSTIEKDNERLIIANNQSQSLIFEYDIFKKSVDFSGDTQFILGTDKKTFPSEYISNEYFKRVHPDDFSITHELLTSIRNGVKTFSAEFRYKTFSNEYIWVKMSGSLIKSDKGTAQKFIGSITNVNAQMLHEQELISIAENDNLTGLFNKTAMEQKIQEELSSASNTKSALFIIDLDNFKQVNDQLGHLTGDMAIKDAAKKLTLIFSEKDYIGRFGGDEFCILLRLSDSLDQKTIDRIIKGKIKSLVSLLSEDYFDDTISVHVSASVGIAICPDHGTSYEELFHNADQALYSVKQNGKDGYKIYSPE